MLRLIAFMIISTGVCAQNFSPTHVQKLDSKKEAKKNLTYEDYAHEFEGCPENSICKESTGKVFKKWNELLKSIRFKTEKQKTSSIKKFYKKHGLPFSFLTIEKDIKNVEAAYWSSHCKIHNEKGKDRILKGITFLKKSSPRTNITLDKARIENKVFVLPYEKRPLMILNNKVVFTMDFDDIYFYMSADEKGKWDFENISPNIVMTAINSIQRVECPDLTFSSTKFHSEQICKKIWNADLKKEQIIKMDISCP